MASLTHLLSITIIVILGFLSISSTEARPCKTVLITSYSIPYRPRIHLFPNDLTDSSSFQPQSHGSVTIVSSGFLIDKTPIFSVDDNVILGFRQFHNHHQQLQHHRQESKEDEVVGGVFGMFDSLRDRTKDVLSVVFALLLGVGCGALTAGVMYLLWFFFTGSCCVAYDSEDDYDDDDDITAKKIGYVMIPSEVDAVKPKQVDITVQPVCNKV